MPVLSPLFEISMTNIYLPTHLLTNFELGCIRVYSGNRSPSVFHPEGQKHIGTQNIIYILILQELEQTVVRLCFTRLAATEVPLPRKLLKTTEMVPESPFDE